MKKQVARTSGNSNVATYDYGADKGAGFEGTTGADLSIPFLTVLQGLSQQVVDDEPKGARSGMLYNTVTHELFDGERGIVFQPCHKELAYVEWVPLSDGGGFVGLHDPNSDVVKKAVADNGGDRFGGLKVGKNELIETYYMYGLILDEQGAETSGFAVMAFTSTKIKPYRDWITAMYLLKSRPPLFAHRVRIRSTRQENKKGKFFNFQIDPLRDTWTASLISPTKERPLLEEGRSFVKMVTSGMARAAFESQGSDVGGSGGDSEAEDPPF